MHDVDHCADHQGRHQDVGRHQVHQHPHRAHHQDEDQNQDEHHRVHRDVRHRVRRDEDHQDERHQAQVGCQGRDGYPDQDVIQGRDGNQIHRGDVTLEQCVDQVVAEWDDQTETWARVVAEWDVLPQDEHRGACLVAFQQGDLAVVLDVASAVG